MRIRRNQPSRFGTSLDTFRKNLPSLQKLIEFLKLGTQVGFAQIIMQGIGFASGILIIRVLAPEKYALYTLAYTFLGAMSVLSDSGISKGVLAEGGKVWTNPLGLGRVLVTGLKLRRLFAVGAAAITIPTLGYMLRHHGASWTEVLLLELAILPLFYIQLSESLLAIVPRLHQRIGSLQRIGIGTTLIRFALLCIALLLAPYAAAAIFAAGIASVWGNFRMRRLTRTLCQMDAEESAEARKGVLKVVKRVMPGSIYYCFSSSLGVWLISVFGDTESLASVGALARIAQLMVLFSAIVGSVFIPRFARLPENRDILFARFIQTQAIAWVIGACVIGVFFIAPNVVLYVLGSGYSELTHEVILQSAVMAASFINLTVSDLASSRGWILPPVIQISGAILAQIASITIFGCSTVSGVLMVALVPQVLLIVMRNAHAILTIIRLEK